MARTYNASRREQAANKTREAILAAAFRLHGEGVFDLESLAEAANVSLATVRKHFPTKDVLFEGCTAWGMHRVPQPDVTALGAIEDRADRARRVADAACLMHEAVLGQMWGAYRLADEYPALAKVRDEVGRAIEQLACIICTPPGPAAAQMKAAVRGLLSPLTYRAFRVEGKLSAVETCQQVTAMLLAVLGAASAADGEAADH